jgi:hypothetical protein
MRYGFMEIIVFSSCISLTITITNLCEANPTKPWRLRESLLSSSKFSPNLTQTRTFLILITFKKSHTSTFLNFSLF